MKTTKYGVMLLASVLAFGAVTMNTAEAKLPVKAVVSDVKQAKTIVIKGSDAMQFDLKEIKVKAGQKVKLTLTHSGKLAKAAMGHNWVLLKPGTDVAAFGSKAAAARETEYIPKSEAASIIAHTKLVGGGESDTVEFTAPAKGTYTYICSFPGHYALMKGTFIVE
ncbi:azurin [Dyadobacter sp. LJ53]|uniref:azurin n=1 Tax=Dyadobacter chenwenxiniae TaxID=2906456 RepID=UPI001F2A0889|nr:azurin [Dyadobacter chenwenxiniae]MCF0050156.1 azurin [Dyadobacter chenwenxiniae]